MLSSLRSSLGRARGQFSAVGIAVKAIGARLLSGCRVALAGVNSLPRRFRLGRGLRPAAADKPAEFDPQKLIGDIQAQSAGLLSFTDGLEGEFMALSRGLMVIHEKAGQIQSQYGKILALTSPQDGNTALVFAMQLLKKAEDLILASHDRYRHLFSVFKEVEQGVGKTLAQQAELQRAWTPLPLIVVQLRIQASFFEEHTRQSFFTLAGEIETLLAKLRSSVERQFHDLGSTQLLSDKLVAGLIATIEADKASLEATLIRSRTHLGALNQVAADSAKVVEELSRHRQDASREIERVVMALQCQDITHQKIQHVCQALDELGEYLCQATNGASPPPPEAELRQYIATAASLQLSQIRIVFDQLDTAGREVTGGIRGLQAAVENLGKGAMRIGQLTSQEALVQQTVESMRGILRLGGNTIQKTDEVARCLLPLRETFADYAAQTSSLAHGVRLAALNGQIYAAQVARGACLSVLGEQTRVVSEQTVQAARFPTVHRIGQALIQIQDQLQDFQDLARLDQQSLTDEAALCEAKLRELLRELPRCVARVPAQLADLAALVEQNASRLRFPAITAQTKENSIRFFETLARLYDKTAAPIAQTPGLVQQLDRLKDNYTMLEERQFHEAAINRRDPPPPKAVSTVPPTPEEPQAAAGTATGSPRATATAVPAASLPAENMGDNIEFF